MRTGRAVCTSPCRTRCRHRSRRSSSSIRCASSATGCGSARAEQGQHRGGDGVVRELRVLEDCRLSIISERRTHAPQGERGGEPGAEGRNALNGEPLPGKGHARRSRQAMSSRSRRPAAAGTAARVSSMSGRVEAIFLSPEHGELPTPVERVQRACGPRPRRQPLLLGRRHRASRVRDHPDRRRSSRGSRERR